MTPNVPALPMCEVCSDPGRCCRKMFLHSAVMGGWKLKANHSALMALVESATHFLPMVPAGMIEQDDYCYWYYSCPELRPNGRCGIYEHRPQVCRDFAPGSDQLCVYHVTPPPADPGVASLAAVVNG